MADINEVIENLKNELETKKQAVKTAQAELKNTQNSIRAAKKAFTDALGRPRKAGKLKKVTLGAEAKNA